MGCLTDASELGDPTCAAVNCPDCGKKKNVETIHTAENIRQARAKFYADRRMHLDLANQIVDYKQRSNAMKAIMRVKFSYHLVKEDKKLVGQLS